MYASVQISCDYEVRIEACADQRGVRTLQVSEVPHPDALPLQEVRGRRGAEQDGGVPAVRVASLVGMHLQDA